MIVIYLFSFESIFFTRCATTFPCTSFMFGWNNHLKLLDLIRFHLRSDWFLFFGILPNLFNWPDYEFETVFEFSLFNVCFPLLQLGFDLFPNENFEVSSWNCAYTFFLFFVAFRSERLNLVYSSASISSQLSCVPSCAICFLNFGSPTFGNRYQKTDFLVWFFFQFDFFVFSLFNLIRFPFPLSPPY